MDAEQIAEGPKRWQERVRAGGDAGRRLAPLSGMEVDPLYALSAPTPGFGADRVAR